MLLFIEGYPYNLDEIVKDGLSVRDVLKDVVSVPVKEDKYSFEYVGYCYSKAAKDVVFFLPKVVLTGEINEESGDDTIFGASPQEIIDFESEAVKSITVDGKTKKACKLKLVPEEADIVKTIFDLYVETDSLTLTEAALIKQGFKTKNGKYFTRFSVKAILQNPVYMVADQEAYDFFIKNDTDLFSEHDAFDGVHGMMAYNRTDQEKGRASISLPPSEWIVSVGKHPGLIPGKVWVQVQESLERNKSKSFRKPRSNEALLTGLLFCSCGERMYPKMSKRKTADGKVIYTYVCKMKERSQRTVCNSKNANGNTLDMAIIEQVKMLADDKETFVSQLEQSRKFYTGNRMDYEQRISDMRKEGRNREENQFTGGFSRGNG